MTPTRWRSPAGSSATSTAQRADGRPRARGARSTTRPSSTASSRRPAQALRRARGHRPPRRRLRVRRVQGALRETLVCGFAHITAIPVGIVANNGILFSEAPSRARISSSSAASADSARLPAEHHRLHGRLAPTRPAASPRTAPSWCTAVATANVPKFTVMIGGSFGAGNYGMCGRAYSPRFLWMWPNARISVMGGEQAAACWPPSGAEGRHRRAQGAALERRGGSRLQWRPIHRSQFERRQSHPYYASARLWDDGVIDPRSPRSWIRPLSARELRHDTASSS
jgi:hypothetical protein